MTPQQIAIAAGILAFVLLIVISYVKAPPDMAYIISGLKRRTVIGGANFRIPFLERLDKDARAHPGRRQDVRARPERGLHQRQR